MDQNKTHWPLDQKLQICWKIGWTWLMVVESEHHHFRGRHWWILAYQNLLFPKLQVKCSPLVIGLLMKDCLDKAIKIYIKITKSLVLIFNVLILLHEDGFRGVSYTLRYTRREDYYHEHSCPPIHITGKGKTSWICKRVWNVHKCACTHKYLHNHSHV